VTRPFEQSPNLFILGAPKCGTTALAAYLDQHPEVCISRPKEPHFFNDDFNNRHTRRLADYRACFAAAEPRHRIIGEASVLYLYSRVAVPNIMRFCPDAKFIVMIRNPLEMAPSWYSEAVYSSAYGETASSFEEAWRLQAERRAGRSIPTICSEPKVLLYQELCSVGGQLQRLLSLVRRERVHIVVFDDFTRNTKAEYRKALAHLGIEDDGRLSFPVMNAAKQYTHPRVYHRFVRVRNTLKRALRISGALGIGSVLRSALTAARERHEVPARVKDAMIRDFAGDVRLLETILERDLSSWFKQ
jgi:hypothetical protein